MRCKRRCRSLAQGSSEPSFCPCPCVSLFLLSSLFLALRRALSSSAPGVCFACLPGRCAFGLPVAGLFFWGRKKEEGVKPVAALEKTGAMSLSQHARVGRKDSAGVSSVLRFSVSLFSTFTECVALPIAFFLLISLFDLPSRPFCRRRPPALLECRRAGSAPRCPCESPARADDWLHSACRSLPRNLA